MKLFINAINLSSAGGLNVTLNFLKGLVEQRPEPMMLYVAAPRQCGYETLASPFLELLWLPEGLNSWVARLYTDYVWVPALIKKINPDVVLTMGNFATPTLVRQVLLLHYPHPAYPNEAEVWERLDGFGALNVWVRNFVFRKRLRYVDILLVQTTTMKKRIRRLYPTLPSIRLLPNAYTRLNSQLTFRLPFVRENHVRYLLCLSRYYPHKNLEILVDVACLIRQRNLPYRLLITIEPTQHRNARRLLDRTQREQLTDVLINIGNVAATSVASLHEQVDGILLPTLLESFTATYVDALHVGLPIFTSRRDFSEEICGDCAYYFDPLSASDIATTLDMAFGNRLLMQQKIADGRARSAAMPDWSAVTQMGLDAIESVRNPMPVPVRV